ncbi:MAG TPA: diguanylate cyclase [Erythrobacter sp.]|nr:diguanylate cyclase [Erythrobacter sp.]
MSDPEIHPRNEPVTLRFASHDVEHAYRRFFLGQDKRQAVIAIALFAGLKASFGAIDVIVQTADQASVLLALRFSFVLTSVLVLAMLGRVREPRHYDVLIFAWALLAVASQFYTISHRPSDHFGFLSTSPILILLFFGFFRNRLELQLFAAALLVTMDLLTVFLLRDPLAVPVLIQTGATYGLAMVVGMVVSLQLKRTRRSYFATLQRERELGATMSELAYRDDLTGVLNRRSFLLQAGRQWQRGASDRLNACMLMLDLDHFKRLNDLHGHEAGDQALIQFATLVESLKRQQDLFGRIGGEEFALFQPATTRVQAQAMADRIVARCQALSIGVDGVRMSVSAGIAETSHEDADLAATMLRADKALYCAKTAGRGRSVMAGEDEPRPEEGGTIKAGRALDSPA